MIRRAVRGTLGCIGLLVVLFVTFFVPLGKRTLFQHFSRIAQTEEAKDLGREAGAAGERLTQEVTKEVTEEVTEHLKKTRDADTER